MALNAVSHNASMLMLNDQDLSRVLTEFEAGEPTGSVSGPPPELSDEVSQALQRAAKDDPLGQNIAGKDKQGNNAGQAVMGEAGKEKTAKESEKDP
jgi:hypothetical protein